MKVIARRKNLQNGKKSEGEKSPNATVVTFVGAVQLQVEVERVFSTRA